MDSSTIYLDGQIHYATTLIRLRLNVSCSARPTVAAARATSCSDYLSQEEVN